MNGDLRHDLCELGEIMWNFNQHSFDELMNSIDFCVQHHEILYFNIFAMIEYMFDGYHHDRSKVLQFAEDFLNRTKYILPDFYDFRSWELQTILTRKGYINFEIPEECRDKSIDVLLKQYEPDSYKDCISTDDIDNFKIACFNSGEEISTLGGNAPTLLDVCAEHGAIKCFKFLLANDAIITNDTLGSAMIGNNFEIINLCEQSQTVDDMCLDFACNRHHNDTVYYLREKYNIDYDYWSSLVSFNFIMFFEKLDREPKPASKEIIMDVLSSAAYLKLRPIFKLLKEVLGCSGWITPEIEEEVLRLDNDRYINDYLENNYKE